MIPCSNCGKESSVSIPGTTKHLHMCKSCITVPRLTDTFISELSMELSADTFLFLLQQFREKDQLVSHVSVLQESVKQLKTAVELDMVDSLRKDRENLTDENEKLKAEISNLTKANGNLHSENETLKSITTVVQSIDASITDKLNKSTDRVLLQLKKTATQVNDSYSEISLALTSLKKPDPIEPVSVSTHRKKPTTVEPEDIPPEDENSVEIDASQLQ